jgi:hypothetical protein
MNSLTEMMGKVMEKGKKKKKNETQSSKKSSVHTSAGM